MSRSPTSIPAAPSKPIFSGEPPEVVLAPAEADAAGVLAAILDGARTALQGLRNGDATARRAWVGTVRGSGLGASFTDALGRLERTHPIEPEFPFEGSERVGGAVWPTEKILGSAHADAAVKLRWLAFADDLPMHAHRLSDRFIVALAGRGYFHVSEDPIEGFRPASTRTIAVRERDVLLFTRGVVHTFSTADEPLTLLSVHLPFVPLEDDAQYTLPSARWTAREHAPRDGARVTAGRWARLV